MNRAEIDAIVSDYFDRLEALLAELAPSDRDQLMQEIRDHVAQARAALLAETQASILDMLERVGRPEDIAREALGQPGAQPQPPPAVPTSGATARRRPGRRTTVLAAGFGVLVLAAVLGVVLSSSSPAVARVTIAPTAAVGGFPTGIAYDAASGTVYVASGTESSLSIIDARTCNASTSAGCARTHTVSSGGGDAIGVVVDDQTGTVYAVNGSGSVAVIDARTCNAQDTSGCSAAPALVEVSGGPEFIALDATTDTVYVADTDSGTVSVIDGATCNAGDHHGCSASPASVSVGGGAFPIAADESTNTVYVGTLGGGLGASGNDVYAIDGSRCDAATTRGCAGAPKSFAAGSAPSGIALDPTNDTLYVSSENGTVSVIDAKTCNRRPTPSMSQTPAATPSR